MKDPKIPISIKANSRDVDTKHEVKVTLPLDKVWKKIKKIFQ